MPYFCDLTLFWMGVGALWQEQPWMASLFLQGKNYNNKNFVSVYVWMVPWKSFLGFVFKIFEKRKKFFLTILTSKGPPFGKKIENFKKKFFFWKISHFFFMNLYCTCSKLSFDVYNSHVSKNFKLWPIFLRKISFFTIVFWQPAWPKLHFIKCCFWCLWTANDQKI